MCECRWPPLRCHPHAHCMVPQHQPPWTASGTLRRLCRCRLQAAVLKRAEQLVLSRPLYGQQLWLAPPQRFVAPPPPLLPSLLLLGPPLRRSCPSAAPAWPAGWRWWPAAKHSRHSRQQAHSCSPAGLAAAQPAATAGRQPQPLQPASQLRAPPGCSRPALPRTLRLRLPCGAASMLQPGAAPGQLQGLRPDHRRRRLRPAQPPPSRPPEQPQRQRCAVLLHMCRCRQPPRPPGCACRRHAPPPSQQPAVIWHPPWQRRQLRSPQALCPVPLQGVGRVQRTRRCSRHSPGLPGRSCQYCHWHCRVAALQGRSTLQRAAAPRNRGCCAVPADPGVPELQPRTAAGTDCHHSPVAAAAAPANAARAADLAANCTAGRAAAAARDCPQWRPGLAAEVGRLCCAAVTTPRLPEAEAQLRWCRSLCLLEQCHCCCRPLQRRSHWLTGHSAFPLWCMPSIHTWLLELHATVAPHKYGSWWMPAASPACSCNENAAGGGRRTT